MIVCGSVLVLLYWVVESTAVANLDDLELRTSFLFLCRSLAIYLAFLIEILALYKSYSVVFNS